MARKKNPEIQAEVAEEAAAIESEAPEVAALDLAAAYVEAQGERAADGDAEIEATSSESLTGEGADGENGDAIETAASDAVDADTGEMIASEAADGDTIEMIASDAVDADTGEMIASDVADADASDAVDADASDAADASEASLSPERLETVLEAIIFASDKALTFADVKRLVGERDGKKLSAALEALQERMSTRGIQLVNVAGAWQLRTNPDCAPWVTKLVTGKPQRMGRAMMETLAIVAYRQPITRPEIDEIRGVDSGPALNTLLDRNLIRVIGRKEEVGRPMLYGTTSEFLRFFSLKDLTELPTLREFHELAEAERAKVDAVSPPPPKMEQLLATDGTPAAVPASDGMAGETVVAVTDGEGAPAHAGALDPNAGAAAAAAPAGSAVKPPVPDDEEDALLDELEEATQAATKALGKAEGRQQQRD